MIEKKNYNKQKETKVPLENVNFQQKKNSYWEIIKLWFKLIAFNKKGKKWALFNIKCVVDCIFV